MPKYLPPKTGGDFELAPSGSHVAVCYRFVDLGTQETTYMGKPKHQHLVILSWELSDEKMSDGRPFSVHKRYTWSTSEKANLRKDLESWRGQKFTDEDLTKFDISSVLGKGCMLSVTHDDKGDRTYVNVASIMRLPKGVPGPKAANPLLLFDLDDFDERMFSELGERLREQIAKSPEYKRATGEMPSLAQDAGEPPPPNGMLDYGDLNDEIPF